MRSTPLRSDQTRFAYGAVAGVMVPHCDEAKKPKCAICAKEHATKDHRCSVEGCRVGKGRMCPHVTAKCANCGGPPGARAEVCAAKRIAQHAARGWRSPSPSRRERRGAPGATAPAVEEEGELGVEEEGELGVEEEGELKVEEEGELKVEEEGELEVEEEGELEVEEEGELQVEEEGELEVEEEGELEVEEEGELEAEEEGELEVEEVAEPRGEEQGLGSGGDGVFFSFPLFGFSFSFVRRVWGEGGLGDTPSMTAQAGPG